MNITVIYLFREAISTAIMCDEIQTKKQKKRMGMTSTSLHIV